MKVEIIEKEYFWELEDAINSILSEHKSSDIFDIKYSGVGCHSTYGRDHYSAMIIFNETK